MTDIFGKGHPDEPKAIYPGDCTKGEIGYCNAGRWAGWIFWRHPDGQWVSLAKIPDDKSADRPAAVSRADAIAARKSIENMTRSFTDMKPWQEICKRLLDDVIGDDPVMVDEVNPPAAVDVEDIRNGLRIVIDSVKPDPTNWHKVDMILEDLIRHGHLTPAPTGERAEALADEWLDKQPIMDTEEKRKLRRIVAEAESGLIRKQDLPCVLGHLRRALSQPVHCTGYEVNTQ